MSTAPHLMTLSQWSGGSNWRLELQHSVPEHAFIWITRGQAICTFEGLRRGLGVHNALVVPADSLFSLQLGPQGFGQVCLIPRHSPLLMPDTPQLLRIRDAQAQAELTGLFDAMQREQNANREFADEALRAYGALLTVWLRRAMVSMDGDRAPLNAANRLVMAFSSLVARDFRSGKPMAEYARALGVTPTHLTRACKSSVGLTAADILTQCSLHAARDLLENSEDTSEAIAAQLGFSSAAYFSRFVKHHTGRPPSALRRKKAD